MTLVWTIYVVGFTITALNLLFLSHERSSSFFDSKNGAINLAPQKTGPDERNLAGLFV